VGDARARMSDAVKRAWLDGLADEIQWWDRAIRSAPADAWGPRPLRPDVAALLESSTTPIPAILDIGAGPLTDVGSHWPGRQVRVVAVDPLADVYDRIFSELGIRPSVQTSWCHGELLHERFAADSFDLVFAQNALDHSYAPDRVIKSGLQVLKPGATMLLRHWVNEGQRGNYGGLHQWNFDCQDDRFVIWNRATRIDVTSLVAPWAEVTCRIEERRKQSGVMAPVLGVQLEKRSGAGSSPID
jgi:SAM-dependent methyltransferase